MILIRAYHCWLAAVYRPVARAPSATNPAAWKGAEPVAQPDREFHLGERFDVEPIGADRPTGGQARTCESSE